MPQTQRSGPRHHAEAAPIEPDAQLTAGVNGWPRSWDDVVSWWEDPRLSYAKGLRDGAALERARQAQGDDRAHRSAVQAAVRFIDVADRRAAHDRGEVAA